MKMEPSNHASESCASAYVDHQINSPGGADEGELSPERARGSPDALRTRRITRSMSRRSTTPSLDVVPHHVPHARRAPVGLDDTIEEEVIEGSNVLDLIEVQLPVTDEDVRCPADDCRRYFLGSKKLGEHIRSHHLNLRVSWICPCGKSWKSMLSYSIHKRACPGRPIERVDQEFRCEVEGCSFSASKQMAVSQHERTAHPALRNQKRAAEANRPKGRPGQKLANWSEAELDLVIQYAEEFRNETYINVKIVEKFPDKYGNDRKLKQTWVKRVSDLRRSKVFAERAQQLAQHPRVALMDHVISGQPEPIVGEGAMPAILVHPPVEAPVNPEPLEESDDDIWEDAQDLTAEQAEQLGQLLESSRSHDTEQPPPVEDDWRSPIVSEISNTTTDELENAKLATWINRLRHIMSLNADGETLDQMYGELIQILKAPKAATESGHPLPLNAKKSHRKRKRDKRFSRRNQHRHRADEKRFTYARCQTLFNEEPKKLAAMVWENDLSLLCRKELPREEEVKVLYENLWGQEGPVVPPFEQKDDSIPISRVLTPITPREVERKISQTSNSSAAGPDALRKSDLVGKGVSTALSMLFNSLLLCNHYLVAWRRSRTTLIPKAGKDTSDVRNWRPITISSMISRIFSALLDSRLRANIEQFERQKGFTSENGCYNNIQLLNAAIAKAKRTGGVVSVQDVSKAFDTVPHSVIKGGIERRGIPRYVSQYIANMYEDCSTAIKTRNGVVEVELRRGIKQGDPLAPLIFNLAIEPSLEKIERESVGIPVAEDLSISCLAFADDVTSLARDREEAEKQLRIFSEDLRSMGMLLSIDKCTTFEYAPHRKTWYIRDPRITIDGVAVPFQEPEEVNKYLGAKFSSWKGVIKGFEISHLDTIIRRVRRLPLKPMQKLDLLQTYLLPKYIYGLIVNTPALGKLREIDQVIRTHAKEILHLPHSVSSGFLYSPRKCGGLGLPNVERSVLIATIRQGLKARESTDLAVSKASSTPEAEARLCNQAEALGLPWPTSIEELDRFKEHSRRSFVTEWSKQKWQGQGVLDFASEKISNAWLTRSDLLRPSRVIDAIKLRTNTVPTRVVMQRIDERVDSSCRLCRGDRETLGHILGKCRYTKDKRIHRHDEIKNLVRERLSRRCPVYDEPEVRVNGERFKPDLVVRTNELGTLVLDVTVRYENRDSLRRAHEEKKEKYRSTLGTLMKDFKTTKGQVLPIVVGSRGALPPETRQVLTLLRIPKRDWLTISMIALRSSVEMVNAFMDE